jgi:hypothetical protein
VHVRYIAAAVGHSAAFVSRYAGVASLAAAASGLLLCTTRRRRRTGRRFVSKKQRRTQPMRGECLAQSK